MDSDQIIDHYSDLARKALSGATITDCAADAFDAGDFGAAGYSALDELPPGAVSASLGCGNPLAVAALRPGETVLDLGSGGGIDVLLSAARVGPEGFVYGLDASTDMIRLSRQHAQQAGVANVELVLGRIEAIPLGDQSVDVVISNCVINLSSDRGAVLAETFRVLRPAGRIGISDVVSDGTVRPDDRAATEQRVGCTAGCPTMSEYRDLLEAAGFSAITLTTTANHGDGIHSAIIQATKA